jgi:hypothetical protein
LRTGLTSWLPALSPRSVVVAETTRALEDAVAGKVVVLWLLVEKQRAGAPPPQWQTNARLAVIGTTVERCVFISETLTTREYQTWFEPGAGESMQPGSRAATWIGRAAVAAISERGLKQFKTVGVTPWPI